jgi:hypothetical protein
MESPNRVTIFSGPSEGAAVGEGDTEGSAGTFDVSSFEALHPARTSPTPPVKSVRRRMGGMGELGFGVMIYTPI